MASTRPLRQPAPRLGGGPAGRTPLPAVLDQDQAVALRVTEPGVHRAVVVREDAVNGRVAVAEVVVLEGDAALSQPRDLILDAAEAPRGDRVLRGACVVGLVDAEGRRA